ncbi:hypothetical protein P7C70_g8103, partial [Phenoliferia sp. Uapishka_3]
MGTASAKPWSKRTFSSENATRLFWCAGEDGKPHWMSACLDLQAALLSGVIRKDNEGKTCYGTRYVPSRAHPRGMRAWVKEQEALATGGIKEQTVRFDVKTNSVEYDPPDEYETANGRVDEYEVNQTRRTRSTSPDHSAPRKSSPRNFKPRVSQFKDLGVPRAHSDMKEDEVMTDSQLKKPRQPSRKLESALESKADPREVLDEILKQPITIPINMMLANSPKLDKLMANECRRRRNPLGEQERKTQKGYRNLLSQEEKEYYRQRAELRQKPKQIYEAEGDDDLMMGGRPSLAFKDLLARADRIEAAARAIMKRKKSEEELEKIFPRRTAPWIASCTAEEASERAQLLRDKYDKFLAVLFGRKIHTSRPHLEKKGYYAPDAWKEARGFGMGPFLKSQDGGNTPNKASPLQIIIDSGIKTVKSKEIFVTGGSNVEYEGFIEDASELLSEEAMAEIYDHRTVTSEMNNKKPLHPSLNDKKLTSEAPKMGNKETTTEGCKDQLKIPEFFDVEEWLAQDDDQIGNREESENSRVACRKYCAEGEAERRRVKEFVAGGRLTDERIAMMDFGPEGWLSSEERNLILNVLQLREEALAFDGSERGKLKATYAGPYKIPVVPHTPWRQLALPIPLAVREKIIETFKDWKKEGLYERSTSAYSGRWFAVAKNDRKYRIVHDLQPLNAVTIRDAGLPPIMEDFVEGFTGRSCSGLMDILGGFDQRELADESRDLTTFQTPLGPVRLTRLPQGGTTSVAEFQRIMVHILAEEIPQYAGVFVNDVGIKGPESTYNDEKIAGNPEIRRFVWEYAVTLERIFFRFEEAGITGSGQKVAAIVPALNIVGTVVSMEGHQVSKSTRNKISNFPAPQDVSKVRGFLGICTYVRIWIKDFANIARPLRKLTKKDAEFV